MEKPKEPITVSPTARWIYLGIGWLFVALAVIGAFLPVMPTVPFLIVAAWAFERGSPRLHRWLYQHPLLGPPLTRWRDHGVIPRYAKWLAIVSMSGSVILMLIIGLPFILIGGVAFIMIATAVYIVTRPSNVRTSRK